MEICVLNPFFYPFKGGTEKVLLEVYGRLAKKHNITVLTSSDSNKRETEEISGIKVVRLKSTKVLIPGMPIDFVSFENLNREIIKAGAQLYHINNRYQYFYFNVRNMHKKGKLALTIHNSLPQNIDFVTDSLGLIYDMLWARRIMEKADVITAVSKNALDVTVPRRLHKKAHVVFNGVDTDVFKRLPSGSAQLKELHKELDIENKTVLCNGRLVAQKGQSYLIKAIKKIELENEYKLNLMLIGSGPLKDHYIKLARSLGISNRVHFASGLDDLSLRKYYSISDISIMPSLYEPASLVALESMACSMPVSASKIGGLPEMIGDCGTYFMPRDVDGISKSILRYIENPKFAQQLGQMGRKRMIERHSWDKIAKQYEALFLNTIRY